MGIVLGKLVRKHGHVGKKLVELRWLTRKTDKTAYFSMGGNEVVVKIVGRVEGNRRCLIVFLVYDTYWKFKAEFDADVPESFINSLVTVRMYEMIDGQWFRCEFVSKPTFIETSVKKFNYAIDPELSELENMARSICEADARESVPQEEEVEMVRFPEDEDEYTYIYED